MTEDQLSPKAEQTRRSILDAAVRLFGHGGYQSTSMRAIAGEAGVSVGNAYYYFASKNHLVRAFYEQIADEHAAVLPASLGSLTGFAERYRTLLETWVDVAAPYHPVAGGLFATVADPSSPLSPFSADSRTTRDAAIGLVRQALEGSDLRVPGGLRQELPELLWLLQMGVVLFWVHDESPGQRRTRTLIEGGVPVVDRVLRLTRLPLVRGVVEDAVGLLARVRD